MQIRSEVTDYEGSATSGVDGAKGRDEEYVYMYIYIRIPCLRMLYKNFFSFLSRSLSFFFRDEAV